jgi:hypothetical protein
MGWRENGERLREHWRNIAVKHAQENTPLDLMKALPEPGPSMMWTITVSPKLNPEFVNALRECSADDMAPLAAYLASDKPLGPRERKRLAAMLPEGRKTGRPKNTQLRAAASAAAFFYKEWRALNEKQGIADHGRCGAMKDYSAQWVVEDYFGWGGGEPLTPIALDSLMTRVREIMEKPKHLRDHSGQGTISFPAFGWDSKNRQN